VRGEALPARRSLREAALPIGLAHGITVSEDVSAGEIVRWSHVELDDREGMAAARREMEHLLAPSGGVPRS
jgi:predicted homoserine dehydrogenase-like protein